MPSEQQHSFLRSRTQRAVANRRVFPYLAAATAALAAFVGFVVTLIDKQDFPTFGDGVWWAIVTLGTVGYGDIVPHTAWGRVIGSLVIVFGVTFLAFLTATVTSLFVSSEQHKQQAEDREQRAETQELLRKLEQRLAAIEAKLDRAP
jgi:voltage-gated potassium channel